LISSYYTYHNEPDDILVVLQPSTATKYITSVYWVFTTLTTVGYGDYTAKTMYEQIFTMFV